MSRLLLSFVIVATTMILAIGLVFALRQLFVRQTGRDPKPRVPPRPQSRTRPPPPDRTAQKLARGDRAEGRVAAILDGLPPEDYRVYHEIFPTRAGSDEVTEVDHLVVSRFGIFVIETKGIYGDVYVDPSAATWQIDRGTHVEPMKSPLRQNHMHLLAIASTLDVPRRPIRSIVCFADDATTLRGAPPDNVLVSDRLHDHIVGFRDPVYNDEGLATIIRILDELDARTDELRRQHERQRAEDQRRYGP